VLVAGVLLCGVGNLVACGGSPAPRKSQPTALVTLQCDVPDAEVWVDGRYFREVAELSRAFRLRAGVHRIEVRHQNYHSMYYELAVKAGTQKVLRVELAERLP
jgi:hypothetical protein